MLQVSPRPLTSDEEGVVLGLLRLGQQPIPAAGERASWRVVGRCECGCASFDLQPNARGASILADGYGRTPAGVEVGVILWGRDGAPISLEVYMLGTETSELPAPESLRLDPAAPGS